MDTATQSLPNSHDICKRWPEENAKVHVDVNASTHVACPPPNIARNLAEAFAGLLWARMGCAGGFPSIAALSTAELISDGSACEIHLREFGGELRLLLDKSSSATSLDDLIVGASGRVGGNDDWSGLSTRLCLQGDVVGFTPLPRTLPTQAQDFALRALNANRALARCGAGLQVKSWTSNHPPTHAGVMGQTLQLRFPLEVAEMSRDGTNSKLNITSEIDTGRHHIVHVALEVYQSWDKSKQAVSNEKFTFFGSWPNPCEITHSFPSVRGNWLARSPSSPPPFPSALAVTGRHQARSYLEEKLWLAPRTELLSRPSLLARGMSLIPTTFDMRQELPQCRLPVRSQGRCVGAWAFAALGAFEKQVCVLSHGAFQNRFSPQRAIDCIQGDSEGCLGGKLEDALQLLFTEGAINEHCAPWTGLPGIDADASNRSALMPTSSFFTPENGRPLMRGLNGNTKEPLSACLVLDTHNDSACLGMRTRVATPRERRINVWGGAPPGVLAFRGHRMIQAAILTYAAVAATVEVYADFLDYAGGVYQRSSSLTENDVRGYTAVQLLGWGVEMPVGTSIGRTKYWIGESSFGHSWGEAGYFRWLRGVDHLGIEQRALLGLAAGLYPLSIDDDSGHVAGGSGKSQVGVDHISELEAKIAYDQSRIGGIRLSNQWLIACCIASTSLAFVAIILAARQCLDCNDKDESEAETEKHTEETWLFGPPS